jgi:hypothetical protein
MQHLTHLELTEFQDAYGGDRALGSMSGCVSSPYFPKTHVHRSIRLVLQSRTDTADGVNAQIRGGTFEEVKPNVSCIKMYADGSQQCPYSHVEPCMITFCLLS